MWAVKRDHRELTFFLLDNHAKSELICSEGMTIYLGLNAMDYAVLHLRYELASILA